MLYKTQKYYDFLDFFKLDGCPMCLMKKRWLNSFIDTFLYEGVNDRKMRKRIMETGGFCTTHARIMLKHGDPLAHSIIYSVLIDDYLKDSNAKKKQGCLVCDVELTEEKAILQAFLDFFENSDEFADSFDKNNTCVCRPHLKQLKQMTKDKQLLLKLDSAQKENLRYLKDCLDEIIRKHDYRFKSENMTADERLAWQRAVRLMAGIPEE